jgi:urease accessory protein
MAAERDRKSRLTLALLEGFRMSRATTIKSRLLMVLITLMVLILCPLRAEAHLNSTGLGPVYEGLAHFGLSPEDVIPVLALAMHAGLRGAAYGRRALFTLPAAWLLCGFIGLAATTSGGRALTAFSLPLLGGLVAADAHLSLRALTVPGLLFSTSNEAVR